MLFPFINLWPIAYLQHDYIQYICHYILYMYWIFLIFQLVKLWYPCVLGFCSVVSGQFQLEPLNTTVLQGSDVQFNATVQGKWMFMTWTVRELLVLTVPATGNVSSISEQFSATFCSGEDTSCVQFTIHNTTRRESGPVICTVQGDYGSKIAQLYVQGGVINIHQAVQYLYVLAGWCVVCCVDFTVDAKAQKRRFSTAAQWCWSVWTQTPPYSLCSLKKSAQYFYIHIKKKSKKLSV